MSKTTQPNLPLQRLNSLVQNCLSITEQLNAAMDETIASVMPVPAAIAGVETKPRILKFGGLADGGGANWQ